jgi:polyferredoxin
LHLAVIIAAVVLIVASYTCLFKSLNENFELQHEINAKLPPGRKFEPLFWWFGTRKKFRELQKELLPHNQRLKRSRRLGLLFFIFFFSAVVLLGIGFGKL